MLPLNSASWVKMFGRSCTLSTGTFVYVYQNKLKHDRAVSWLRRLEWNTVVRAVLWLRRFVTGFSPQMPRFEPRPLHMGFVVDKVERWQTFLWVLQFSTVSIIPTCSPYTHLLPTLYNVNIKKKKQDDMWPVQLHEEPYTVQPSSHALHMNFRPYWAWNKSLSSKPYYEIFARSYFKNFFTFNITFPDRTGYKHNKDWWPEIAWTLALPDRCIGNTRIVLF